MEVPEQETESEPQVQSTHSRSNEGSLTHYAGLGVEPASHCSQEAMDPVVPWSIIGLLFNSLLTCQVEFEPPYF